jgi:alkanesulfonate monooxygenase SsuD/methylene tetrahydromethanopterin reductase-like flavin-dependent oxidoreductase (luciferase family)
MKFGVFDHMDRGPTTLAELYEMRLKLCELYDREGFYAYHLAEHHSTPLGTASAPSVFLAAVAQRTQRLRFGPLVYTLSLSHPLRVLEEICMLDQMSGGRLEVGIGRGSSPYEMAYFGVDAAQSGKIYTESYAVLMQGLTSDQIDFEGEVFRFRRVPVVLRCVQQPHPPLWYGLSQPAAVPWVAKSGLNIVCNGPAGPIRAVTDRYREEWRAAHPEGGTLPLLGMGRHIVIAEDGREARDIGRRAFALWYANLQHLWKLHGNPMKSYPIPEDFDAAAEAGIVLAGTPDEVAEGLQREIETAGVNYVLTRFAFGDLSFDAAARSVRLFARHVMPRFATEAAHA